MWHLNKGRRLLSTSRLVPLWDFLRLCVSNTPWYFYFPLHTYLYSFLLMFQSRMNEAVISFTVGGDTKAVELSPTKGLCGRTLPQPIYSTGTTLTFKFRSQVVTTSTGFRLLATAHRRKYYAYVHTNIQVTNYPKNQKWRCIFFFIPVSIC